MKVARQVFLILFLCTIFIACSSDDSTALSQWFEDHGIANSYSLKSEDIYLSVKKSSLGANDSAYLISSYAALGKTNGVEQLLYFGLEVSDALSPTWKLRTDSIFYKDIYEKKFPDNQKTINAEFCWLEENETQHDSLWLKFSNASLKDNCKPIKKFDWKKGSASQDTFSVLLPDEFLNLRSVASSDPLKLLASIKLITDNTILRIAPPSTADIPGLLRVAQKTIISDECEKCLHAGVRESLFVSFGIRAEDKIKIADKPVVFAELIFPRQSGTVGSELGHPVVVNVYSDGFLEDYRVDTAFVKAYGHPNLVFWDEADSLRLQVTNSLRRYAAAKPLPDSITFVLRLGTPVLIPKSFYFYNSLYSSEKVFSDRFAFARYDFSSAFAEPKLRLWFADFGDNKK
jgi:hypothetical protein